MPGKSQGRRFLGRQDWERRSNRKLRGSGEGLLEVTEPADRIIRGFNDKSDPQLFKACRGVPGWMLRWSVWMMGGCDNLFTPQDLADFRGVGLDSAASQLEREALKGRAGDEGTKTLLISKTSNAKDRLYRLISIPDMPQRVDLVINSPTHRGELMPCTKCGEFSRYLGEEKITGKKAGTKTYLVFAHVDPEAKGGLRDYEEAISFCRIAKGSYSDGEDEFLEEPEEWV